MISIDKLYFMIPKRGKFLDGFRHNDQLKHQAEQVWDKLDGLSPGLIAACVLIGIGLTIYYYTGYNEQPGRHYKVKHWGIWAGITAIFTFLVTFLIEYIFIKTNLRSGVMSLYFLTALNNAIYAFFLYFITSAVWCNFFSTNAYRFLKFTK